MNRQLRGTTTSGRHAYFRPLISFNLSMIGFLLMFLTASLQNRCSFLVLLFPVMLSTFDLGLVIKSYHKGDSKLPARVVLNAVLRTVCYSFAFCWAVIIELTSQRRLNMLPGFVPLLSFSVASFVWAILSRQKEKQVGFLFQSFYRLCRILVHLQLVVMSANIKLQDERMSLDIEDLGKLLWPIHVSALLLLPGVFITFAYYLHYLYEMFVRKDEKLRVSFCIRRLSGAFTWLMMSLASAIAFHVLLFIGKQSMFVGGSRHVVRISICILVSVLNLTVTLILRENIRYY